MTTTIRLRFALPLLAVVLLAPLAKATGISKGDVTQKLMQETRTRRADAKTRRASIRNLRAKANPAPVQSVSQLLQQLGELRPGD